MTKYKIKVEFDEEIIEANTATEALEIFWSDKMYPNTDMEHLLDENTTIKPIK